MPAALKARVLAAIAANKTSRAGRVQANAIPPTEVESVSSTEVESVPSTEVESVPPTIPAQPGLLATDQLGSQQSPPEDDASDSFSYTSTLPDVFEVGLDDSAPLATGPWVITDHLTGEIIVDEEVPPATRVAPYVPSDPTARIQILGPIMGIFTLVQTPPPTLLFEDGDERPEWLARSTRDFLQHAPYYLCMSEVVDLFFTQEARLGYPSKVNKSCFPSCLRSLIALFTTSLLALACHQPIGLPKLARI